MGWGQSLLPCNIPLECLLRSLKDLGLGINLKPQRPIFFCNSVWLQYKLDNRSIWPENRTLNPQILTTLNNFCRRLGKWSEVPYAQAFFELRGHPSLCQTCSTYQILLLHSPLPQQCPSVPSTQTETFIDPSEDSLLPPYTSPPPPCDQNGAGT